MRSTHLPPIALSRTLKSRVSNWRGCRAPWVILLQNKTKCQQTYNAWCWNTHLPPTEFLSARKNFKLERLPSSLRNFPAKEWNISRTQIACMIDATGTCAPCKYKQKQTRDTRVFLPLPMRADLGDSFWQKKIRIHKNKFRLWIRIFSAKQNEQTYRR